jgi:hypothetical protein
LQDPQKVRSHSTVRYFFFSVWSCANDLLTAESYNLITDDHERFAKVARMTEIEDLKVPQNLHYAPLCIKVRFDLFS